MHRRCGASRGVNYDQQRLPLAYMAVSAQVVVTCSYAAFATPAEAATVAASAAALTKIRLQMLFNVVPFHVTRHAGRRAASTVRRWDGH
jgi:hypothetical protein